MTENRTALIIGGGIAGPVTAMALRRAGIESRVYEAYDEPADGVGAMVGLAPNGLDALGVLGADAAVRDIGTPVASMVMRSWTGKRLAEFGGGPEPVFHAVWRADLYRALYDEAASRGIEIEHGKRFVHAEDHGDGVTATFADGSNATADILIGADGIRSAVRGQLFPDIRPRYTGLLGFGAMLSQATGLPSTNGSMHMVFGKRAFFAYQVEDDGRTGWFANLPRREPMSLAEARAVGGTEWLRVLTDVFAGDRIPALEILRQCVPEELVVVGALEDLPNVPQWSKGRIVLVGDAAHATSPSSGQGVSQAIESALHLARCLRDVPTAEGAFAAYERLRRARVERVIAAGARTNRDKAAGPVARVVRDAVLPVAMKLLAKPEKMAWQTEYHIDWDETVDPGELAAAR
ncbi:FAD-dependent monooxygenase [Amycolatopsis sp. K13G38]|uniref:FAD-dependent monooxygenase n=1 Tax=Amycolatopsis acididurans TaxID=2724524 RepID=A0ABX1JCD6_9PSEU|nr:NAD(P)/FAD-dependent oxidoreductase [Amycolatopsis acididurans]NKQ56285.1 FAD-dependent monooxygenase [Amycolatopsis acididurans]